MIKLLTIASALCISVGVWANNPLPPDSEYVVPKNGDLYLGDQRINFWGGIGGFPPKPPEKGEDPYAHNYKMLERIKAYGFNMMRIWGMHSVLDKANFTYTKGDGSQLDRYDHMISLCRQNGIYLWVGSAGDGGTAYESDADIIPGDDQAEWAAAIKAISKPHRKNPKPGVRPAHMVATMWDPRLEAIMIRNNAKYLNHVNQHTGFRRGDDPVYAIWELVNEQWWIVKMVSGKWQKLPPYFKKSLIAKWHTFLKAKYKNEAALTVAWGNLKPGESLEKGTIYLAPGRGKSGPAALNDANPHASEKFASEGTKFGRDDFNARRGMDVNEFFTGIMLSHKARVAKAFKTNGKSTQLASLLHDTGIGYNGIAQYMQQQADAISHCAYIAGWTHDKDHKRYPWFSGLEEPPRICQNVPWLEHNTVEGKPYFVYETQIGAPSKFRAEFPYRMVFLAAIQGWDAVCWHTMGGGYNFNKENAVDGPLAKPGHAAYQFTYKHDELQLSAMRAAGEMFRSLSLKAAPKPTTFVWGKRTLYHPDNMDYAGSYGKKGMDMLNTAYRHGSRIVIDPTREDDEVKGPVVPFKGYAYPNPLNPTGQMEYNWNKGFLTFDTNTSMAFTGFIPGYGKNTVTFANGGTISGVSLKSPKDMTHAVTQEEGYVAIGLTSTDGKPLAECKTAVVSAVSTSHNKGLDVAPKPDVVSPRHAWDGMKVTNNGSNTETQFTRVGCTIKHPGIAGMTYTIRNWHMEVVGQGTVGADGALTIADTDPTFLVELKR